MLTALVAGFQSVPVHAREQLAEAAHEPAELTAILQRRFEAAAVVATCNRFEIYCPGAVSPQAIINCLVEDTGIGREIVQEHLTSLRDTDAVRHLFRVAAGLDSMVLGEFEILGQLRRSLEDTRGAGHNLLLSHLFHSALRAGRRVRTETGIAREHISLFSVLADHASTQLPSLRDAKVLIVGAGEAAIEAAQALQGRGATALTVANRTLARAQEVAARSGGCGVSLAALPDALVDADLVVTAVGSAGRLITAQQVASAMQRRPQRSLSLIDVAVPTNVDPAVRSIANVWYCDVDDLRSASESSTRARHAHVPQAEAIVENEVERFGAWVASRAVVPTITGLTNRAEQLRIAQVERATRRMRLAPGQREQIDQLTRALVKQLLHAPIAALHSDQGEQYAAMINNLFALDPVGGPATEEARHEEMPDRPVSLPTDRYAAPVASTGRAPATVG